MEPRVSARPSRGNARLGSALIIFGLAVLALYALTSATREWTRAGLLRGAPPTAPSVPSIGEEPGAAVWADIAAESLPAESSAIHKLQRPARLPIPASPSERLLVPRIEVDSTITDVFRKDGEWPVPKWVVGHLGESPHPGSVGNAVFAGHLHSLSSGNVFARLDEMEIGDELTFVSVDGDRLFRVIEARLVANTDVTILADRPGKATVTLITCAGTWIPRDNDYDQRRVVVAEEVVA